MRQGAAIFCICCALPGAPLYSVPVQAEETSRNIVVESDRPSTPVKLTGFVQIYNTGPGIVRTYPGEGETPSIFQRECESLLSEPFAAKLTRVAGIVQIAGCETPPKEGDLIAPGSVISTGRSSWAELKWHDCVVRIWQDTIWEFLPKKRELFLHCGSMRFQLRHERVDKRAYRVRTPSLMSLIRGTTIYADVRKDCERISVLEGTYQVDVRVQE